MLRFATAGLVALALVVLSNDDARGGSVHSPFTKAEVKESRIRLYEHEVNLRDQDPTAFDHKYPVLGQVLSSEAGYDKFLEERTFHHGLLCEHDPFLWRVVDGDILYHKLHPFIGPPLSPDSGPTLTIDTLPGAGGPNPPGSGGTIHSSSVPEPSSWVLMVSGVILALLAVARRRVFLKLSAARRLTA